MLQIRRKKLICTRPVHDAYKTLRIKVMINDVVLGFRSSSGPNRDPSLWEFERGSRGEEIIRVRGERTAKRKQALSVFGHARSTSRMEI